MSEISIDILNENLNDAVSFKEYLSAFGYGVRDTIYLRQFYDPERTDDARNREVSFSGCEAIFPALRDLESQGWGTFFVVNGGGQSDKKVKVARAQFIDMDDFDFEEQIRRINAFALEPSIIIKTKKSLHCYWLLDDGDIRRFRNIQLRLIQHFGSDPVIKNESRVMRLYGFLHQKSDPVMVTLIKFDPELRYTQDQLSEVLPEIVQEKRQRKKSSGSTAERIPEGERNNALYKKSCSLQSQGLPDSAILAAILKINDECCDPPLSERECEAVVESALKRDKGKLIPPNFRPDDDPEWWDHVEKYNHDPVPPKANNKRPLVVPASEIRPEHIKYLWRPYIIDGNANLLGGEAGTGKTWFLMALMAAVTGDPEDEIPGSVQRKGNVIYLGVEDGNGAIKARLDMVDADSSRCLLNENPFDCTDGALEELIDQYDPVLIIFDPLMAYFPKDANTNSYTDTNRVMNYLVSVARSKNIAILAVIHPSKKEDYRLIHRFSGSGSFVNSVRSAVYVGYHPSEPMQRVVISAKNNTASPVPVVFQLDPDLGFSWVGYDSSITEKQIEDATKIHCGKTGNIDLYADMIRDVLKINPDGIDMTASEILNEYKKVRTHRVEPRSFGSALSSPVMAMKLKQQYGITLHKSSRTNNRQRYAIYHERPTLMDGEVISFPKSGNIT